MKLKHLEAALQEVETFRKPNVHLEQCERATLLASVAISLSCCADPTTPDIAATVRALMWRCFSWRVRVQMLYMIETHYNDIQGKAVGGSTFPVSFLSSSTHSLRLQIWALAAAF